MLSLQRVQVQPLVGKLSSCMPRSVVRPKRNEQTKKGRLVFLQEERKRESIPSKRIRRSQDSSYERKLGVPGLRRRPRLWKEMYLVMGTYAGS